MFIDQKHFDGGKPQSWNPELTQAHGLYKCNQYNNTLTTESIGFQEHDIHATAMPLPVSIQIPLTKEVVLANAPIAHELPMKPVGFVAGPLSSLPVLIMAVSPN